MGKAVVVVNPVAGQGAALGRLPELKELLSENKVDHEIVLTERPMHAAEVAESSARAGADIVVAAGGDGTANEVVNGLMRARGSVPRLPALGMLCVGRGNDFAFGAGVPTDIAEACQALAAGHRRPMDVGLIVGGDYPQGRYFGNGIGVGFDTIVGLEAAKMKHVHGFLGYVFGAVRTLCIFPRPPLLRLEYGDAPYEQRCPQISVMNGRRMGGTFFMAPDAANDDGLFDLCVARSMTRRQMIATILKYMKGTQASSPFIKMDRTGTLEITALDGGLVIHADGETICTAGTHVHVECFRHQIEVICRRLEP